MQQPNMNGMPQPDAPTRQEKPQRPERGEPKHRGRFMRFMRGYLMIVGGAATVYALIYLIVRLFVKIGAWVPAAPGV